MAKKYEARKCEPGVCDQCIYIGEGDSFCEIIQALVLSDWTPTDNYMGEGCLYRGGEVIEGKKDCEKTD